MKPKAYVILLQARGEVSVKTIDKVSPSIEQLEEFVAGRIQTVPAKHGVLVFNEESKIDALPINEAATTLLRSDIHDLIRGDAVLLREDGDHLVGFSEVGARRIADAIKE